MIQPRFDLLDVLLRVFPEIGPLGDPASDLSVHAFVRAPFTGTIGMTVIDRRASSFAASVNRAFHSFTVRKLRAVIHGDRLEDLTEQSPEFSFKHIQAHDDTRCALVLHLHDDPHSRLSFCQHEDDIACRTADTVHFPMPETAPREDLGGAAFNTQSSRHFGSTDFPFFPSLFLTLFLQVGKREPPEHALLDIAIKRIA